MLLDCSLYVIIVRMLCCVVAIKCLKTKMKRKKYITLLSQIIIALTTIIIVIKCSKKMKRKERF